jgi:hypothetical protein
MTDAYEQDRAQVSELAKCMQEATGETIEIALTLAGLHYVAFVILLLKNVAEILS